MTEEITFRNPVQQLGYSMRWNVAASDLELSHGAYRLLSLYLKYAQQKGSCWPGIKALAKTMGHNVRTITRYNHELSDLGYITRHRRKDDTSVTIIEDVTANPRLQAIAQQELDERQDRTPVSDTKAIGIGHECPVEKEQTTEYTDNIDSPSENLPASQETPLEPAPLPSPALDLDSLPWQPVPPKRTRPLVKSHPRRKTTPHQSMVAALGMAFRFPPKMDDTQVGRLRRLASKVLENEYTEEQVKEVGSSWWSTWPGNTGQVPKDHQFLERLEQHRVAQGKWRKV